VQHTRKIHYVRLPVAMYIIDRMKYFVFSNIFPATNNYIPPKEILFP